MSVTAEERFVEDKLIPGANADIDNGIAEAELHANGVEPDSMRSNVLDVGGGIPRLGTFESILLDRRRRLQSAIKTGHLTVRKEVHAIH